ncbi:MAG: hypothetical protein V7K48_16755 [Nostoc sp.]
MRLPDTVAETLGLLPESRVVSKTPAPLSLGSGALTLNCTPRKWGVHTFKRTFPRATGLNPALRVNRAPVFGVLGGFERQNWVF